MAVIRVEALCECEGCQKRFGIELDLAEKLSGGDFLDFEALVRQTIRDGMSPGYITGVRGKATVERYSLTGPVTIQGNRMLCDVCTKICDALPIDRNLTRDEVNVALGKTEGE